jgi:hypothetical protein
MRGLASASLCLALGCGPALAADEVPSVTIEGVKSPEMKNYRSVVKGMDSFEEYHALAPKAALHFRMRPRRNAAEALIEGVSLKIVGDGEPVAVAVAKDGLFTMPRLQAAYDDNAILLLNRKKDTMQSLPDIRTPGLPGNVRRLGDLRLECKVMVAIAKDEIGFAITLMINSLLLTRDWCSHKEMDMGFKADAPLAAARIIFGQRSEEVKFEAHEFHAPIGDKSWPDDTFVELTYQAQ